MVEIQIAAGSQRTIHLAQDAAAQYRLCVQAGATVMVVIGLFVPKKLSIELVLEGSFAQASVYYLVGLQQGLVELTVVQHHKAPDTKSSVLVKGLLNGTAQARLHGTITIDTDAKHSHASQYHKVLLLSQQARAIAVPSFTVNNHQVRCNHGAAVGRLDNQQLLYLQSRGITSVDARKLLIRGFVAELLQQAPQDVKQQWEEQILSL